MKDDAGGDGDVKGIDAPATLAAVLSISAQAHAGAALDAHHAITRPSHVGAQPAALVGVTACRTKKNKPRG